MGTFPAPVRGGRGDFSGTRRASISCSNVLVIPTPNAAEESAMPRPSRIGITSPHRPSALELALRGSSLGENTIPEEGENKILPGWISVSGCDRKIPRSASE
jgi:hypothetical protein